MQKSASLKLLIKIRDLLNTVDPQHIRWTAIQDEIEVAIKHDSERSEPLPKPASESKKIKPKTKTKTTKKPSKRRELSGIDNLERMTRLN